MEGLWSIITIVGPILFIGVLIYVVVRNRQQTKPGDEERSDRAATRLRAELSREDKAREGQGPQL